VDPKYRLYAVEKADLCRYHSTTATARADMRMTHDPTTDNRAY
jgi:hypothetical protein